MEMTLRSSFLAIIMAVGMLGAIDAIGAESSVSIVIRAVNTTIKSGNDVNLEIVMTNNSSIPAWYPSSFKFEVFGPGGVLAPKFPESGAGASERLDTLGPGEEVHELHAINRAYDMVNPGQYNVDIVRIVGFQGAAESIIQSNIVTITVTN
jgi:hypothetical protein